ncbi:nucleotidyltransferase domain-containing protein [Kutzneria kofuensis]|uniref:cGAS/DncV-like nucleotidyltransferase C-terminal helical domain-containing protein n=1 Tax=Kutzneria kofuensis TaxID=103725 RepID=A0A7W9NL56_9PSEU|nr:nucleotidyltransferase domain-containing protein [Kutzneria kofuensis]MBB5896690.1 hypothetical protein [Kutzneria kofuensis]
MDITPEMVQQWSRKHDSLLLTWTRSVLTTALADSKRLEGRDYEIFGQGSFANETNIAKSSDVDLVVALKLPFQEDISVLSPAGKQVFKQVYEESLYDWHDFRSDVIATLRRSYHVVPAKKCLDISDFDSLLRLPADVVPALEYREYSQMRSAEHEEYRLAVYFHDADGKRIVSYPRQHHRNGQEKDRNTRGRFKEIVRVVKNAREFVAPSDGKPTVSSYLLECLVYNVPNEVFRQPLPMAFQGVLDWLVAQENWLDFQCQNGIKLLFGEAFPTTHEPEVRPVIYEVRARHCRPLS